MNAHRRLIAWQKCYALTLAVYEATDTFPKEERYSLVDQLRRAAVSAPVNIAEWYGRYGRKELQRFVRITLGSIAELDTLLLIARDRRYLGDDAHRALETTLIEASKTTMGFFKAIRR